MQDLTRRTALTAVPLLAAMPASAAANANRGSHLEVSPHIAELFDKRQALHTAGDTAREEPTG